MLTLILQVQLIDGNRYTVRFVDYGLEEILPIDCLLPLPAMFAEDPSYSWKCSLYGIKPSGGEINTSY